LQSAAKIAWLDRLGDVVVHARCDTQFARTFHRIGCHSDNRGPLSGQFPVADQNGVFLLCFALGWFLITLLTALSTCTQWWALIPGGIMALIGGAILVTNGAFRWLDLNLVYAAILIVIGLVLLVFRGRPKNND